MCSCSVRSDEYNIKAKLAFVYDIHFKLLHQPKRFGYLIDNKADALICVLGDNDRESKLNFKDSIKHFFGGMFIVEYFYKIVI